MLYLFLFSPGKYKIYFYYLGEETLKILFYIFFFKYWLLVDNGIFNLFFDKLDLIESCSF